MNNYKFLKLQQINRSEPTKDRRQNYLRLDKNERAEPHQRHFFNKLKKSINSDLVSAYPDLFNLYNILSKKLKISKKKVLLTQGADHAIKNCFEVFYKKNSNVIILDPTFVMVNIYCKIFKTKTIKIGYKKNLILDFDKLIKSLNKNVSMVILANPNSPSGTIISDKKILEILHICRKKKIQLVIDEAYFEFSKSNSIKYLRKFSNLTIIRTFSKIYGLAGLRIGYLLSSRSNIKKLYAIKPMYEINSIAAKSAEIILKSKHLINDYLSEMMNGLKYAENFCSKHGFKILKTNANFFYIKFKYNPKLIKTLLKKKGILVKQGSSNLGLQNYLRISYASANSIKKTLSIIKNLNEKNN